MQNLTIASIIRFRFETPNTKDLANESMLSEACFLADQNFFCNKSHISYYSLADKKAYANKAIALYNAQN